jgi:hypothetical protein
MISFSLPRLISSLGLLEVVMDYFEHQLNTLPHPSAPELPNCSTIKLLCFDSTTLARKNVNLRGPDPSTPMAFAEAGVRYCCIAAAVTKPKIGARTLCEQVLSLEVPTPYIVEGLLYFIATAVWEQTC